MIGVPNHGRQIRLWLQVVYLGYILECMRTTTLSIKTTASFAKRYRTFCDVHALQVGKFAEQMLTEVIEDFYFGQKAQRVLSKGTGRAKTHERYFKKKTKSKQ